MVSRLTSNGFDVGIIHRKRTADVIGIFLGPLDSKSLTKDTRPFLFS